MSVKYGRVYERDPYVFYTKLFGECLRTGFWFVLVVLAIILGGEFL